MCQAWGGQSAKGRRLGEVTAGPSPTSFQVHCGQLSDSEEWSLQAVEKHVSLGVVSIGWGLLKILITTGGEGDPARELDRPGF